MLSEFPPAPEDQVTLANWRQAPHSAWAFHHVREIVPSAHIAHDPGAVRPLEGGAALDVEAVDLPRFITEGHVDGLVVLHRGKLIFEQYANGMGPQDPHILMSVSKSMLGLLAGILADRGILDLDAMAEIYVPELTETAFAGVTVHQLLDMRTGITFDEDYEATAGAIIEYRKSTNWNPLGPGETPTDLRSFLLTLRDVDGPHGGVFDYKSPCTDLLGWIIERAAGAPYPVVFSDFFWKHVGAEAPAYITVDRLGAPRCAGGVCMTTRDLARVGQLLVDGGGDIVPAAWIDSIEN
ncbi:MAG: serine hydrolase, partial [Pseudomonadota bacterium]